MPADRCCEPDVHGACCPRTFRHGKRSTCPSSVGPVRVSSGDACLATPAVARAHRQGTREPTAAIIDAQSTRSTSQGGNTEFDARKKVKGRKRHRVVDMERLLLAVSITAASVQDGEAAAEVVAEACAKDPVSGTCIPTVPKAANAPELSSRFAPHQCRGCAPPGQPQYAHLARHPAAARTRGRNQGLCGAGQMLGGRTRSCAESALSPPRCTPRPHGLGSFGVGLAGQRAHPRN